MKKNRIIKTCLNCGKPKEIIKSREHVFKYCSNVCHGKAVLGIPSVQKRIKHAKGHKNGNWHGGIRKHSNGYQYILIDGKYHLEHRYVMRQHLGRKLLRNEQVHHKNHNKLDNRIENLEVVSCSEHIRKHHAEGFYKPMGWSRKFINCQDCGTIKIRHWAKGYCQKCYRFHKLEGKTE